MTTRAKSRTPEQELAEFDAELADLQAELSELQQIDDWQDSSADDRIAELERKLERAPRTRSKLVQAVESAAAQKASSRLREIAQRRNELRIAKAAAVERLKTLQAEMAGVQQELAGYEREDVSLEWERKALAGG